MSELETLEPVTNGGAYTIAFEEPYVVSVTVEGTAPLLMHAWNVEAVAEKASARKGSRGKKEDNLESYVYRDDKGNLSLPGEYFRQSIINAARFKQDPRSPRKSAMDLLRAGVLSLSELCSLGSKGWHYVDRRRVTVQRAGVTRSRPAMKAGWATRINFEVVLPEYIPPDFLHEIVRMAGKLIGVGDFRPTYGRFAVTNWKLMKV